jgi:hypothetical protein
VSKGAGSKAVPLQAEEKQAGRVGVAAPQVGSGLVVIIVIIIIIIITGGPRLVVMVVIIIIIITIIIINITIVPL